MSLVSSGVALAKHAVAVSSLWPGRSNEVRLARRNARNCSSVWGRQCVGFVEVVHVLSRVGHVLSRVGSLVVKDLEHRVYNKGQQGAKNRTSPVNPVICGEANQDSRSEGSGWVERGSCIEGTAKWATKTEIPIATGAK